MTNKGVSPSTQISSFSQAEKINPETTMRKMYLYLCIRVLIVFLKVQHFQHGAFVETCQQAAL